MTETTRERTPFSVLLREYRLAASLSQEALAERAGLSAKGIALLESGRRSTPRPETVTLLAAALDLAPAERAALIAAATRARTTRVRTPVPRCCAPWYAAPRSWLSRNGTDHCPGSPKRAR
ncbi:MAG: helix-turn-helix transcriptional regulator [Ktedonobacterales bacterium]